MDLIVNDERLEAALAQVEEARNWSPRVISKLENTIRTAEEEGLFRLSPLHWAQEKKVDEYEAIDLFLHASKAGLFYMEWDVICPCCGKITQSLRDLHSVESVSTCKLCLRKDRPNLDDAIQITFTLSPTIRSLRFHHPESLSLEDYCFKYLFEPGIIIGGFLPLRDAAQYSNRHLSAFAPGEKITVETQVEPGALTCMNVLGQSSFALIARGEPATEVLNLKVRLTEAGFQVPLPEMQPSEFSVGPFDYAGTFYAIRPGKVSLEFEHAASAKSALLVAFFGVFTNLSGDQILPADLPITPEISAEITSRLETLKDSQGNIQASPEHKYSTPRLTAKRLFACQTFHDLYRAEVFQDAEGFGVKEVTILFTDLKGSTQLYQRIGDLNAYALVREHYGVLNRAIIDHHGAIVKTIGDAVMANFAQPVEAVAAGLEMLSGLRSLNNSSPHGGLILKIGIHKGAAISVTLNNRIDYFGQTVNIASRVQGSAGGDEIYLTEEIFGSNGVQELLGEQGCQIESFVIELKGIDEQVKIFKVTAAN